MPNRFMWTKRFALTSDAWTAIIAPCKANYYMMKTVDGLNVLVRTDVDDATTEDSLSMESLIAPSPQNEAGSTRMEPDQVLFYCKSLQATNTLIVKFYK